VTVVQQVRNYLLLNFHQGWVNICDVMRVFVMELTYEFFITS